MTKSLVTIAMCLSEGDLYSTVFKDAFDSVRSIRNNGKEYVRRTSILSDGKGCVYFRTRKGS